MISKEKFREKKVLKTSAIDATESAARERDTLTVCGEKAWGM